MSGPALVGAIVVGATSFALGGWWGAALALGALAVLGGLADILIGEIRASR